MVPEWGFNVFDLDVWEIAEAHIDPELRMRFESIVPFAPGHESGPVIEMTTLNDVDIDNLQHGGVTIEKRHANGSTTFHRPEDWKPWDDVPF